jgi:hypothetical protein
MKIVEKIAIILLVVGVLMFLCGHVLHDSTYDTFVKTHGDRYLVTHKMPVPVVDFYWPMDHGVHDPLAEKVGFDEYQAFVKKEKVRSLIYLPGGAWYSMRLVPEAGEYVVHVRLLGQGVRDRSEFKQTEYRFKTGVPTALLLSIVDLKFDQDVNTLAIQVFVRSSLKDGLQEFGTIITLLCVITLLVRYLSAPSREIAGPLEA